MYSVLFYFCAFLFWQESIFGPLPTCNHIILLFGFEYFIQSRDLGMLLVLLQQCLWALVMEQGLIVLHTVQVQDRRSLSPQRDFRWCIAFWYPNVAFDFKTT